MIFMYNLYLELQNEDLYRCLLGDKKKGILHQIIYTVII